MPFERYLYRYTLSQPSKHMISLATGLVYFLIGYAFRARVSQKSTLARHSSAFAKVTVEFTSLGADWRNFSS